MEPPLLPRSIQLLPSSPKPPFHGDARGAVSGSRCLAPVLAGCFFSCLLKDKVKGEKAPAKPGFCLALPLDSVYNCYFRGWGEESLFVSVQKGPSVSMSMRTSPSEREEQSALNDLKMVTLDPFLKKALINKF